MIEVLGVSAVSFVAGALVIVVGSVTALAYFLTKEEKFEDVVEAQRREQEELLQSLSTSQSNKSKKRAVRAKGKNKVTEEKLTQDVSQVVEKPFVEDIDLSTNAEPETANFPSSSKAESSKVAHSSSKATASAAKSTTVTKKDPPKPSKQQIVEEVLSAASEDTVQAAPPPPSAIGNSEHGKSKKSQSTVSSPAPVVQANALSDDVASKKGKAAPKSKKKAKKDVFDLEAALEAIQIDHLGKSELQLVTDTLLAKQAGLEDWKTGGQKGDALEALKKQLQQLTDDLDREKSNTQASAAKVKDLRQEIEQMKGHCKIEVAKANAMAAEEAKEKNNLRRRLENQTKSHSAEMQELMTQRSKHSNDSSSAELQKLREESMQLKKVSIMAQQLNEDKNSLLKECEQLQQSNKHLRGDVESLRADSDTIHKKYKEQVIAYDRELARYKGEVEILLTKQSDNTDKCKTEDNIVELGENIRCLTLELENHKRENAQLQYNLDKEKSSKGNAERSLDAITQEKTTLITRLQHLESLDQQKQREIQELSAQRENLTTAVNQLQKNEPQSASAVTDVQNELQKSQDVLKEKSEELQKLKEKEEEASSQLKHYKEVTDNLKQKNNDLREKNWKAMDALENAEKSYSEKAKNCKRKVIKCMKTAQPNYKADGQAELEDLLDQFQNNCMSNAEQETQKGQLEMVLSENSTLKTKIEELETKVEESHVTLTTAQAEVSSAISDRDNYKTILQSTESMLKELQDSVEMEIAKWQEKVSKLEEDLKLASNNKTSGADLDKLKKELQDAVSRNNDITAKMETMSSANRQLTEEKTTMQKELSTAKDDLSTRTQEATALNKAKEQLESSVENLKKDAAAAKQTNTLKAVAPSSPKSDVEKDKIIARLKLENADLEEQLRDERDQIVVDVAPSGSPGEMDDLKQQVETLTQQLSQANESKGVIEKTSTEMNAKLDEVTKKNGELNQALQESESARSKQIEKAIDDAISQLTSKLQEREKQLEDEKQTTTQLRLQVAALQQGMNQEGTSV